MYINSRKVSLSAVSVLSQKWAAKHGYQSARAAVCKWHAVIKAILFYPQLPPAATRSRNEHRVYRISWRDVRKGQREPFRLMHVTRSRWSFFLLLFFLLRFSISRREKMRETIEARNARDSDCSNLPPRDRLKFPPFEKMKGAKKGGNFKRLLPSTRSSSTNFCNKFIHGEIHWFVFKINVRELLRILNIDATIKCTKYIYIKYQNFNKHIIRFMKLLIISVNLIMI